MMEKLANRNQQRLKDKAEALREEARNSSGAEAERLNNEADFWEEKTEAETIRGKHEKKDINIHDDFSQTLAEAESLDIRGNVMDLGGLLGRSYQYNSFYQPMEKAAPYDPQFDEAIPNTTLNTGRQSYQEITVDPMPPIEPLEPLDYHLPFEPYEETIKMRNPSMKMRHRVKVIKLYFYRPYQIHALVY